MAQRTDLSPALGDPAARPADQSPGRAVGHTWTAAGGREAFSVFGAGGILLVVRWCLAQRAGKTGGGGPVLLWRLRVWRRRGRGTGQRGLKPCRGDGGWKGPTGVPPVPGPCAQPGPVGAGPAWGRQGGRVTSLGAAVTNVAQTTVRRPAARDRGGPGRFLLRLRGTACSPSSASHGRLAIVGVSSRSPPSGWCAVPCVSKSPLS